MSFNVKHYVAIGLGFAVLAGFAMQRSTSHTAPAAFESAADEFKPLSSLDANEKPPSITVIHSNDALVGDLIPASKIFEESALPAEQVVFDFGDPPTDENDFVVPEFVDDSEMDLEKIMWDDSQPVEISLTESTTDDSNSTSAFVTPKPSATTAEEIAHHYQRPNSRWKRNPFAGQSNTPDVAPVADESTAQIPALNSSNRSTIIVEPNSVNPAQEVVQASKNDNSTQSGSADASRELNSILVQDDEWDSNQSIPLPIASPNIPTAIDEVVNYSSTGIVPLQIRLSPSAALQAVHHIEYGKSLSRRGAAFAARQEFYSALRIIAESNDATTGSNDFCRALSQSILAMKEAKDFVREDSAAEMQLDVTSIVETHRSNIISAEQAKSIMPAQALKKYFSFAQQKLDEASGHNVVSAEALYCLGKLHTVVSRNEVVPGRIDIAKAMAFHQAALNCDSNNYRSANELGVLMAKTGQLEMATELFKQSLISQPKPQTWNNLAKTHRRLGQQDLAQLAEAEFSMAARTQLAGSATSIQWLPTTTFNATAPMEYHDNTRIASRPDDAYENSNTNSDNKPATDKTFGERLKELF